MKNFSFYSLIFVAAIYSSCAHKPKSDLNTAAPEAKIPSGGAPLCTDFQKTLTGQASFYGSGKGFVGKRTSCGNIFTGKDLTAAVKRGTLTTKGTGSTLKCGTAAKVTDQNTGQVVWVTLDDTGRLNSSRVIDLSFAAAKQLNMINAGTAEVQVQICADN